MDNRFTVAFYNLENFFDTVDDPHTLDDDFTETGKKQWTENRFRKKTKKIANTIAHIGKEESSIPPVLVGLAEVENENVLNALTNTKAFEDIPYDWVHFDSPDERGIDTALLYNTNHFEVLDVEIVPLFIHEENGVRDLTRDILYVYGKLNGEPVHIFVNHWPSRRDGAKETEFKRLKAAETVLAKIDTINEEVFNCIVMGDFNDNPTAKSIETLMESQRFINPMQSLLSRKMGSANYKGQWSLFDQIILSHSFLNFEPGTPNYKGAQIFAPKFLRERKGRYKGTPFRTYAGKKYLGGYSDHFPVYVIFQKN
ncbi:MAG: endonuclease [Bacteroidota bacterium]